MKTLIKGGSLVSSSGIRNADILISNGKIERIAKDFSCKDAEIIDAEGMYVFPGFVDPHTHIEMDTGAARTADDFFTGTRAAIIGGTTTILDFATQNKGETLGKALENWHQMAEGKSCCDYGFHMAITDWNERIKAELEQMPAKGVTSYKLYMAYDMLRVSDAEVYEVLEKVGCQGGIVGMHCENGDLVNQLIKKQINAGNMGTAAHPLSRPDSVEAEAVNRFLAIAKLADCAVNIVHLSSGAGLEVVRRARGGAQAVYVEGCPQYLLLEDSVYSLPNFEGAKYVISPPLRKKADNAALWKALERGEIDTIATDHCPFTFKDKQIGRADFSKIPNGAPGVDLRPQLMYTYGVLAGRMSVSDMCRMLSENPAKLFGMYPQKGALIEGADADIVVWDSGYAGKITDENHASACDFTPYNGFDISGRAGYVYLRGQLVAKNGRATIERAGGYVKRSACSFWR